jgi:hypothetical protein
MNAQGAVLQPIGPSGMNYPVPISVGRRFSRQSRRSGPFSDLKKGTLRRYAKRHMEQRPFTRRGTLKMSWLSKISKRPDKIGARARLAIVFNKARLRKRSKKNKKLLSR